MDAQTAPHTRSKKPRTRGRELLTKADCERAKPHTPSPARRTDGTPKTDKAGKLVLTDGSYRLADGGGLYLYVTPAAKFWQLRYLHPTKRNAKGKRVESMLSIGRYPEVSLAKARDRARAEREIVADGEDPSEKRRLDRRGKLFRDVAGEWLALQEKTLAPKTYQRHVDVLERWVFPYIGGQPVAALDNAQIVAVLKRIDDAGKQETARRTHQRITGILQLAKAHKLVTDNVAADINRKTVLSKRRKTKHHAGLTDPLRIGQLLRDIDEYQGHKFTAYALKLAPLLFVRPGELRFAEWAEFTLHGHEPQWTIPAEKMKMKRPHIVPLAKQAVALLTELHLFTGQGKYLFPALTGGSRTMSENTLNQGVRRLGYSKEEHTAHGFRTTASTRLNAGLERSKRPGDKYRPNRDWIEMQLSHDEEDESREAYNGAEYLDERRTMMAEWAKYLDRLRAAKPT
jgi:integrase